MNSIRRIRVLHVTNVFGARSETFIYNYLTAMRRTTNYIVTGEYRYKNEFPFEGEVMIIPNIGKRWSYQWTKNNVCKYLTGRTWRSRKLDNFLRNIKPSVIHAHFGPNGYEMLDIKRRHKLPLITSFYGYDMSSIVRNKRVMSKYRKLFREGDCFLVEGPHMCKKLIELGAPEERVFIQRIGIYVDKYPKWEPNLDKEVILFVGRFVEKKGLIYALEAIKILINEGYRFEFRIIGDGELRNAVNDYIEQNGIGNHVRILGMQSHDIVINELKRANILIHPSVTASTGDTEGGAPTILLEAQAIGTPIITTFHADIPNILTTDPGIIIKEEKDVYGLVDAIKTLLKRKICINNLFVYKFHNIHNEVSYLEKIYHDLDSMYKNNNSRTPNPHGNERLSLV